MLFIGVVVFSLGEAFYSPEIITAAYDDFSPSTQSLSNSTFHLSMALTSILGLLTSSVFTVFDIQDPHDPEKKFSQKMWMMLAIGFGIALLCAMSAALFARWYYRKLEQERSQQARQESSDSEPEAGQTEMH
ncbi:MAG: hypothetical protein MHM6MM_004960 [Cercozoa sp. M6MM]